MAGISEHAPIRVFLVDDHTVVRRGMRAFFDMLDDIEVLGEAADGRAALDELAVLNARKDLPDVVLMDLFMPRLGGVAATAAIRQLYPHVEVVALTSFSEAERVHGALEAGATGYLLKDAEADEVVAAVRAAHRGEVHLAPVVARKLTRSLVAPAGTATALTPRERGDPSPRGTRKVQPRDRPYPGHQRADRAYPRQQGAGQAGPRVADPGRLVGGT